MKPKPKRKSPHKHTVHTKHKRYKVSSYERGKGAKARERARRARRPKMPSIGKRVKRPATTGPDFHVRVEYADLSFEHVNVNATDYTGALSRGIEARKVFKEPRMIRMRRV